MKKTLLVAMSVLFAGCLEPTVPNPWPTDINLSPVINVAAPSQSVLPSAYANLMGTVNNNFPHSFRNLRYQQVFLGTDVLNPVVTGLCFRRDDIARGAERTQTLTIKLGPTTRDYTNLGSVFDENYSSPPTEVFSGDVIIPASTVAGTPADFDLCIPFTQQYVHPEGSNVIVEVINTSLASGNVPRDACDVSETGCTTSRAYAFSSTATDAFSVETGGLVMKFVSPGPPRPLDPQDKAECKHGGWADFGFRSQGQCIRFVETGVDSREVVEPAN
jgi:hypothetical protein